MSSPKTIFVTGASGFIGKHIVLQLLNAGYFVRASVRSVDKGKEVEAAMHAHLNDVSDLENRLSFVLLDLTDEDGWDDATAGADALMHTASPFPMAMPDNEDDLIRPAVDGTVRALTAAKNVGITRVVLTSSVAAIYAQDPIPDAATFTEEDWTDIRSDMASAYVKSKTLAERAAWDFVADHREIKLTVINPSLVLGPALDGAFGTSQRLIQRMLNADDPAIPHFGFGVVDVRDIAAMHVAALTTPDSAGKRYIGSSGFAWMLDVAHLLKAEYPDRKIVTRRAPNWLVRILARFDKSIAGILPTLGKRHDSDSSRAKEELGIDFISVDDAVRASAEFLIKNGHVK